MRQKKRDDARAAYEKGLDLLHADAAAFASAVADATRLRQVASAHYNLACCYALSNRAADAFKHVHRAVDLGFIDRKHIAADPDLASLRDLAEWQSLTDRLRDLAWLGAETKDADGGVEVVRTVSGSPAEKAGVRAGDRLRAIDGKTVDCTGALGIAVRAHRAGTTVAVLLERDGRELTLSICLGSRPGP